MMVVTDNRGVRIGLTSGESWFALRWSLDPKRPRRSSSMPSVSARAARMLKGGHFSLLTDILIPLALGSTWLGGVTALAVAVARL
jgi:hypothetical protein